MALAACPTRGIEWAAWLQAHLVTYGKLQFELAERDATWVEQDYSVFVQ